MTRTRRGPAPARTGPIKNLAAAKPLSSAHHSTADGRRPTAGELLHRLVRYFLDAADAADATDRLRAAATNAAPLIASRQLDRTAAATVLSVAGQAAGVGQAQALDVLRAALRGDAW